MIGLNLTLESLERETNLVRKVTLIIYYCYLTVIIGIVLYVQPHFEVNNSGNLIMST